MGEDDGQEGEAGISTGYDSDSIKLKSSEWCDDKNDIVSESVSGDRSRRLGGGEIDMARITLGPSLGLPLLLTSETTLFPTDTSLWGALF